MAEVSLVVLGGLPGAGKTSGVVAESVNPVPASRAGWLDVDAAAARILEEVL